MPNAYTPGIEISEGLRIERERRLPVKGEVLVNQGDEVEPKTTVARAFLPGELVTIRVAEQIGVPPGEAAKYLRLEVGMDVEEGEIVAAARFLWGLIRTEIRAPISGKIEYWSDLTGHLGIRLPAKPIEVDAFVSGRVQKVLPEEGVVVETTAAVIQGVLGVGPESHGPVKVLDGTPSLGDGYSGAVAVYSGRADRGMLVRAVEVGLKGLVAASIRDTDLAWFLGRDLSVAVTGDEELPFPVVVTEGFGDLNMSEKALEVARSVEGKTGSLSARTQIRAGAVRPELIVPVPEVRESEGALSFELKAGTRVRLIRQPHFGSLGAVKALPNEPRKIETGAVVPVVEVELEDGGSATVPRANVEVVG